MIAEPGARAAPRVSVVVPCLNEAHELPQLLRVLASAGERAPAIATEIIVADGGSADGTPELAARVPGVRVVCSPAGRAQQLNRGARAAQGDILYFVHADSRPPLTCLADVAAAVDRGDRIGGYAFEFDSQRPLLRFNSWLTTFNVLVTRGGDQSLFVTRELFERLGGFREAMVIMEEYDLLARARRLGARFRLLPGRTLVSPRKYARNAWARVQVANIRAVLRWRLGRDAAEIRRKYEAELKPTRA